MSNPVNEFNEYRAKMNDKILADNNKIIKRIFNLDTNAFQEGALDVKTKELLGLVASTVLRCDDCIKKHFLTIEAFAEEGATLDKENKYEKIFMELPNFIRKLEGAYYVGYSEVKIGQKIRKVRKKLMCKFFYF